MTEFVKLLKNEPNKMLGWIIDTDDIFVELTENINKQVTDTIDHSLDCLIYQVSVEIKTQTNTLLDY